MRSKMPATSRQHLPGKSHLKSCTLQFDQQGNKSKVKRYGIEVVKGLTWRGWEPGGEYTKNIILKNVNVKTQKLTYSSPSSRFFSTLYPEPIILSTGTSFSLPITFRPLEKNVYLDKIEFQTTEGVFDIPIQAVLPQHDLSLPEHLDFGMCASMHNLQKTFELHNISELATRFAWLVSQPFVLEPSEGTLAPKAKCTILATFKPMSALVYETVAECRYGEDLSHKKTLRLEGIGKYPHLLASAPGKNPKAMDNLSMENVISFGDVPIGTVSEKSLLLYNLSPVAVPFTIEHPSINTSIDTVFHCSQTNGIASSESLLQIPVKFQPQNVNEESVDYLHVHAIDKVSKTVVKLVGRCSGPQVSLGSKILNYGLISTGQSGARSVDVINTSSVAAVFQFMIDSNGSAFKFSVHCGKIEANTTQTISVHFKPTHPINYYRRVTCVVQNQDALFLDLIGTCHTELVKPAVLQPEHLTRFRVHLTRGFTVFPPEQLNEILKEGKLQLDDKGCLIHQEAESVETYLNQEDPEPAMAECFSDGCYGSTSKTLHVGVDSVQVDFGQCLNLGHIESKTVNVTNHTKGKMTVTWMTDVSNVFSVTPITCDIPPLKMTSFRISFKPGAPNQFFAVELEGYAFYKSMRDYRLVQDETFCPPWCLTVSAVGHTFQPNSETFLPKLTLDAQKVVFPAVYSGDSFYKTILMTNNGSTPIHYMLPKGPSSTFQVKPTKGLLRDKYQLLVVKTTPQQENMQQRHQLQFQLNDDSKHNRTIELLGSSGQPNILLDSEGVLFLKPTCIGTSSQHSYVIRNVSRIPLQFTWKCSQEEEALISVEPKTGTILPNEIQAHVWTFTPKEERKYVLKPYAYVEDIRRKGDMKRRKQFKLRVVGEGSMGEIKAEESTIDLSDVVIGKTVNRDLVILNNSKCNLHYQLFVDQELQGSCAQEACQQDALALELDVCKGVLPARSRHMVHTTIRPLQRISYTFHLSYQLMSPTGHPLSQDKQKLCTVSVVGVYPTLKVTDARCYGSASGISKARVWSLFSLDKLNMCLESDPSPEELTYPNVMCRSTTRKSPINTRAIMDFNFSGAPQDSKPCIVHLMLENIGTVPTEWSFSFPADLQLELEYWAETGDFDADELHEMRIMDNKLFCVEPRCGKLRPGQCQTITFTYKHSFPGTDRLPMLFKMTRGREILLNFVGVTVEPDRKYVHFPSNKHMFAPVPIGVASHPKQVYELYNGGAIPVTYQLDLTTLEYTLQENFSHKVFECLNPYGEISAGETANVEWIFSPLEAKTYMVDVPIHIIGGDTALITFTGVGYDKRIMGKSMPMTAGMELNDVPPMQAIPMPGQLVYLSLERVAFGNVPLFCQSHRVIEMVNRSPSHSLSFEWYVTSETHRQIIDIQPVTGELQPAQCCTCKVTFIAIGEPSFYDLDIVCEVTNETEMAKYLQILESWEQEKERQKYEFTITDTDMPEETKTNSKLCCTLNSNCNDNPDFQHYQTLPPIKYVKSSRELDEAERAQSQTDSGTPIWDKPEAPGKFLLHLGVSGRTHTIAEFQSNFPNEVQNFFIDRTMGERFNLGSQEVKKKGQATSVTATAEEQELVCGVTANVIRALLDDHDFHEALKDICNEPVPYFMQFGDRPQALGQQSSKSPPIETPQPLTLPNGPATSHVEIQTNSRPSSSKSEALATSDDYKACEVTAVNPGRIDLALVRSQTQSSGALHTEADYQQSLREEQKRLEQQALKRLPEFATLLESVLENCLFNIVTEAGTGETNLTARPRLIALPPSSIPLASPDPPNAAPTVRIGIKRTNSAIQST
ncbi:cilia- and flagella-associated protein 65-like isoform X2 [Acanthaster planci]|uniref:Cilia- and flagella-associated protein 65-like isoform X2 n=1 Tax=Acanthaster planci TaxID=133434 RepID=A0A8B7Z815_ACAPL|nr:cilia- and flagella-associated protein 65-like isoform X2 [Acanthaster planci]